MSGYVRLRHPNLPDQGITVAASAVPQHRAAGWVIDDRPEPTPEPATEEEQPAPDAQADTDPAPEPQPARKRRRVTTEGE